MDMTLLQTSSAPIDVDELADVVAKKVAGMMQQAASTSTVPLPREDFGAGSSFSPGIPLVPYGLDPREPYMPRPAPRRSEFMSSVNLQVTQARFIQFDVLRAVAERVDVVRRCIEFRKGQMQGFDWDIRLNRQALKRIMLQSDATTPGQAAKLARDKFAPKIDELRQFWEEPDPFNGYDFQTWLGLMLEEQLVVDALTVWPRRKGNGDIVGMEIIDGSTIKPLLDHRGSTPASPNPAFQQILYGFPRGEFTATSDDDTTAYRFDQLIYRPRYVRTWTPYGCPNTEQALAAADIYLKRMAWIREEFTEGAVPDAFLKIDGASKIKPDEIRAYEAAINAELAGQDAERRHLRLLPPGWSPDRMQNFADLYKPELDELLIKLLCACFDIMPTEIGFPPGSGIGGKGHQEGEANSSQRKAVRPTAIWSGAVINQISRKFLGMPPELEFALLGFEEEDGEQNEKVANSMARRGGATLNEDRAKRGEPMYPFEEADTPFIETPTGIVFLDGALAAQRAAAAAAQPGALIPVEGAPAVPPAAKASATDPRPADPADDSAGITPPAAEPEPGDPIGPDDPVPDGFIRVSGHLRRKQGSTLAPADAEKFLNFARRRDGRAWRHFEFGPDVDPVIANRLNHAGKTGGADLVKQALADLGKARARTVSRAAKQRLIDEHADRIAAAVRALMPSPAKLIAGWQQRQAATKNEDHRAAAGYVAEQIDDDSGDVDDEIDEFITAGHRTAWSTAWITDEDEEDPDTDDPHSRLGKLLHDTPDLRDDLIAGVVAATATALLSDDPEANVAGVLDDAPWASSFTDVELTGALTAGTLDSAEKQGLQVVQIVASGGECDFCQGYDGRILHLDDDSGMPPLHRGCACDLEPLD